MRRGRRRPSFVFAVRAASGSLRFGLRTRYTRPMAGGKKLEKPEKLPPLGDAATLRPGADLFNRGEYFACHDFFEELWFAAPEPEKSFLQGLILAAVGFHHLARGNYNGATRQWASAFARLERPEYQPAYLNVDTAAFVAALRKCDAHLRELGPMYVRSFDFRLAPRLPLAGDGPPPPPKRRFALPKRKRKGAPAG